MSNTPSQHRDETRRREAIEKLDQLQRHGETIGSSGMAGAVRRITAHFSASDAPDRIELWGQRIGRALSLAGVLGLAIYLYVTYLR